MEFDCRIGRTAFADVYRLSGNRSLHPRPIQTSRSHTITRMVVRPSLFWLALCLSLFTQSIFGGVLVFRGKVTMDDGSVPPKPVVVERFCGESAERVATTDAKGEYKWRAGIERTDAAQAATVTQMSYSSGTLFTNSVRSSCLLRARLPGYESNVIDVEDLNSFSNPAMQPLILSRRGSQIVIDTYSVSPPRSASSLWTRADKEIRKKNWLGAEQELRAVVKTAPKFAFGWETLGDVLQLAQNPKDAQEAYQQAITLNPRLLQAHLMLTRLKIDAKDWEGAEKTAAGLVKVDAKHQFPEGLVFQAIARFRLKNLEGAQEIAEEAIRVDKNHEVPMAEYVYGMILEARNNLPAAREHINRFLEIDPKAPQAASARVRIENLGKPEAEEAGSELDAVVANLRLGRPSQAWVPGGVAALGSMARMTKTPPARDFFTEFCRSIAQERSLFVSQGVPQYLESLRAFMAAVATLTLMGEHHGNTTTVTQSLASAEQQDRASRVLQAVGWKMTKSGGALRVEPGDQPGDGLKQRFLHALGVDEIEMQRALEAGKPFSFEISTGEARLIGGDGWADLVKDRSVPGGIAAVFATDLRFTQAYAAVGTMSPEAASAVVSGVGLHDLVTRFAAVAYRFSDAFEVANGAVVTPGGKENESVWHDLVGAKPRDASAFFKALLDKDFGKMAAFYWAIARGDASHQKFFLKNAKTFYAWYHDSDDLHDGATRVDPNQWRTRLFRDLPLDPDGNIRFPGGTRAWIASGEPTAEVLLNLETLGALIPIAELEQKRKTPFDETSAKLLSRHYGQWSALFPLFEKLPTLTGEDFLALEKFAESAGRLPGAQQNIVMAEWHSLVELMMRKMQLDGGALDGATFRRICTGLSTPEPSLHAKDLLREMAGAGDLDQTVPERLLRLTGERRAAYDRLIALQNVPRFSTAKTAPEIAAALSGAVYAASLDPGGLLVNEDPQLLSKHKFAMNGLFNAPAMVRANQGGGSFLRGGLMNFSAFAQNLAPGGKSPAHAAADSVPTVSATGTVEADAPAVEAQFRADSRLVEVYATVTDSSGHYLDDIPREGFVILDEGKKPNIVAFETRSSDVSVALVLDTTGSMVNALPALKNAALRLIGDLRESDSVAVYSFSNAVHELTPFLSEKDAAKRAVLQTEANGETALYDALTRVGRDLSVRSGKKVIVLFTDGNDNSSMLTPDTAIRRAKATGVPIYTIAQGDALSHPELIKQLAGISKATGGESFVIHEPHEIRAVFDKISDALSHGYLLVFQPESVTDSAWRTLEVGIEGIKGKVRAREGYYPQ